MGRLRLSARQGDVIHVGLQVTLYVAKVNDQTGVVEIVFDAPPTVSIDRDVVRQRKLQLLKPKPSHD